MTTTAAQTATRPASRRKITNGSVRDDQDRTVAAVMVTYSPELSQILVYRTNEPTIATPAEAATWTAS